MTPSPQSRARPLGVGLWALFAILVAAGGWLFLRACGTTPNFGLARNFCPAPPDRSAMLHEAQIGEGLQRQVHAAEMRLAQMPPCAPPRPAPSPAPLPLIPPQQRAESRNMDQRVERRGGKRGKLQFTLSWATTDDLDINVVCPGGRISGFAGHRGPGICGDGIKDIDANGDLVQNVSSTPVENVTWAGDVPDGIYTIEIIEFKARSKEGSIVPFTLRMRWGEEEEICHESVETYADSKLRHEGDKLISGTGILITWQSGGALPDCDFRIEQTFRIRQQK